MNYIIETDIGSDPDDFMAILWLIARNKTIETVFVTPGYHYQVAILNFIREQCDVNFNICVPSSVQNKQLNQIGPHQKFLQKYNAKLECSPDKEPKSNINNCFTSSKFVTPPQQILSIGPMTNLMEHKGLICPTYFTIQGGFVPYSIYRPTVTIEKFDGLYYCSSFNFGGDIEAFDFISNNYKYCTYVSKNICHTFTSVLSDFNSNPSTKAGRLLYEFASLYYKDGKSKKMHDVLAAMISTGDYNESYLRTNGKPVRKDNKFSWIRPHSMATLNKKKEDFAEKKFSYNHAVVDIIYDEFYKALLDV